MMLYNRKEKSATGTNPRGGGDEEALDWKLHSCLEFKTLLYYSLAQKL